MARYPGSQFIVIDNSATTATVPITPKNPGAPTYLTTFNSIKGPEEIKTVYGQEFFDLYGAQNNILFSKYGQPLLQAAMDINAGATLICKRAVLDDARLANATLAVVLTKKSGSDITILTNEEGHINRVNIENMVETQAPMSQAKLSSANEIGSSYYIKPVIISSKDSTVVPISNREGKEYYDIHKKQIIDDILNETTFPINKSNISIKKQSADGVIKYTTYTCNHDGITNNINSQFNTINSSIDTLKNDLIALLDNPGSPSGKITISEPNDSMSITLDTTSITPTAESDQVILDWIYKYFYKESVFPIFTVFDNGRGVSTKAISLAFDVATSKTLNKAIYNLKVVDYKTNKGLESFAFAINPYIRNNATGHTFDIESAVNFTSSQIKVKMHYDSYETLVDILVRNTHVTEDVFVNSDCLFGHTIKGLSDNVISKELLYCDATSNDNNLDSINEETDKYAYYYYNYADRYRNGLSERLLFGTEGTLLKDKPYAEVSTSDIYSETVDSNKCYKYIKNGVETNLTTVEPKLDYVPVIINPNGATDNEKISIEKNDVKNNSFVTKKYVKVTSVSSDSSTITYSVYDEVTSYRWESMYQEQYRRFFDGDFSKDVFNLDVYFPNCIFDANYNNKVKLAIQRLSAFRGDLIAFLDMGVDQIHGYDDAISLVPEVSDENEFPADEEGATNYYVRDMHNAVTCLAGDIKDPYTNKQITVTGTYKLSIVMVNHFITGVNKVFAGKSNGIVFDDFIQGTINYIPKIYPTDSMRNLTNINNTYPSDDNTIMNEKQIMNDKHINYGSYYDNLFVMDTQYTLNPIESEFSYINNVMLVNDLIQAIRKSCPAARYNFVDGSDLEVYKKAVDTVINSKRNNFAKVEFKYLQDDRSITNKIFYAALEITFRPFAQAEIFTITALNYSTLDSNVITA